MRVHLASDLHLEHQDYTPSLPEGVDVVVLAGDIASGGHTRKAERLLGWYAERAPVIYVSGNHEYYGTVRERRVGQLRAMCARIPRAHFLENETVELAGHLFWGATLWSDFRLYGDKDEAMRQAARGISDFGGAIQTVHDFYHSVEAAERMHHVSVLSLKAALARGLPTVAVTHFLPAPQSLDPRFKDDPLNPYYCTDLRGWMGGNLRAWFHGHTHCASQYVVRETTTVACNPRGYPRETTGFDPNRVVVVQ